MSHLSLEPRYDGLTYDEWLARIEPMEFYLHYGPDSLPASPDNVTRTKNHIREALHPQMRELWRKEHILRSVSNSVRTKALPQGGNAILSGIQFHSENFVRGPYKFVPLVCNDFGLICEPDILFFRREDNRALITKPKDEYGGDLDNRLKIFFDALKVPDAGQLEGLALPPDEPVFCLLQDDALITKFQLASAYLLQPAESNQRDDQTRVQLLTKVTTKIARLGPTSFGYETRFFA